MAARKHKSQVYMLGFLSPKLIPDLEDYTKYPVKEWLRNGGFEKKSDASYIIRRTGHKLWVKETYAGEVVTYVMVARYYGN
jgi:hypothetical protein